MKAFDLHNNVIENYKNYILSFLSVKDKRIKERIKKAILENEFVPYQLIQFKLKYMEIHNLNKFILEERFFPDSEKIKIAGNYSSTRQKSSGWTQTEVDG